MNRLDFLKRLGIGAGAAIITPSILSEIKDFHETDEGKEALKQVQEEASKWHMSMATSIPPTAAITYYTTGSPVFWSTAEPGDIYNPNY